MCHHCYDVSFAPSSSLSASGNVSSRDILYCRKVTEAVGGEEGVASQVFVLRSHFRAWSLSASPAVFLAPLKKNSL